MKELLLSVKLSAGYGKTTTLDNIALELHSGECLGIVGTSGAGKSTLMLALLGLLPWRGGWVRGQVIMNGRDLLAMKEREARTLRGKEVALVPQSPMSALNPALTLRTQFLAAWSAHESSSVNFEPRLHSLLQLVQLPTDNAFLNRKPGEISVGQAQRITLAMALLHRPALLIADEPTSALDPVTQVEIIQLLSNIQREEGVALLYISHDLVSVLQLCDSVCVLDHGRIVTHTPIASLSETDAHPALQSLLATLPVPLSTLLEHVRSAPTPQSLASVTNS